jgi:apolipoprotein N-acyltransferase
MANIDSGAYSFAEIGRIAGAAGDFVRQLSGWHGRALALGAGLFSALAFAPFNVFPCLLLAFATVVLLIDGTQLHGREIGRAALVGWVFGFGHFLAGLYWVGYAFAVDPTEHAWQIPFVEILLPGGLALFPAAACAIAAALWRQGPSRIFIFAASYGLVEWSRGHLLTGFPWNLAAYGWGASLSVLQSAAVIGAYGLSVLTILLGASLAELCGDSRDRRLPIAMMGLFLLLWAGGAIRLALGSTASVPAVELRLVQPNVRQQDKYVPEYRARNWRQLVSLSTEPARISPTITIWPEAAPPFLLTRTPEALDEIAVLTARNHILMTGAIRVLAAPDGGYRYFNSLYIFGHDGQLLDAYDKFHLVPFGEYLPLSGLLEKLGISKLVDSPGGFTPGDGPHTFAVPGAPAVGPLICYEILFPSEVTNASRPEWLANVTDDSWFGPSTGPYQHFMTARVRAIEEGLPVVRAANTGISGVIDPYGRVLTSLGIGRAGVVDSPLPRALPITPFARLGDGAFFLVLLACALAAMSFWRHSLRQKSSDAITV